MNKEGNEMSWSFETDPEFQQELAWVEKSGG